MKESTAKFWNNKSMLLYNKPFNSLTEEERLRLTLSLANEVTESSYKESEEPERFS